MLSRSSIYAMVAAVVGAAALAPTGASAHLPMGVMVHPHPVLGVVIHPPHPILGVVLHPPHPVLGVIVHPPMGVIVRPDPPRFWWHHHHSPFMIEEGETTRASAPVATVPTGPCNCLTKKYLQDGSVLFQDVCTKEAAVATPDQLKAQLQGVGPQAQ
jgi:hypothetical protein